MKQIYENILEQEELMEKLNKMKIEGAKRDSDNISEFDGKVVNFKDEGDSRKQTAILYNRGNYTFIARCRIIGDTFPAGDTLYFHENTVGGIEKTGISVEEHIEKYKLLKQKVKSWAQNN